MNDNDKSIAKEILLAMMDKEIGEFRRPSGQEQSKLTTDVIGKAYQNILKYVSSQDE